MMTIFGVVMMTTNITNYFSLKFKVAKCVGPLHCQNDICPLFVQSSNFLQNETAWNVDSMKNMKINHYNPMSNVLLLFAFIVLFLLYSSMPMMNVLCCNKLQTLT